MQEDCDENLKIAVFLRTIRGILGCSQREFAEMLKLPLSTITRVEIMEMSIRYADLKKIEQTLPELGIQCDPNHIPMHFELEESIFRLAKKQIEAKRQIKEMKKATVPILNQH
jgi:transcriptional regulator with XRE-family HTH domain